MANSFNSNPIQTDTDMTTGWRAAQTLNTGNLPTNAQQLSGAVTRQWGIQVTQIKIVANTTTVAGQLTFIDPNDSTVIYPPVAITAGSTVGTVMFSDIFTHPLKWRDFKITGQTAAKVTIHIWYRA